MKGYNRLWAPMRKSLNLSVQSSADVVSLGSFSNDDGDVNANDKKTIGLDWPNNNFARASRFFFAHFFAVTARLRRENF